MPSKSKKQQRLMGMAYAYAKGEMKDAPKSIKNIAKSFTKKDKKKGLKNLKHFATTKHKNLVDKVTKLSENHIFRFEEFSGSI